jgi:predicted HicB family RNase H-like nuclease
LRIPGYLKEIISEAAKSAGDSVNSYVVDALRTAAPQTNPRKTVNQKIQL